MGRPKASGDVFCAIADPTRRRLLDLLGDGERAVADLARPFRMSQPALSQHLRVLREAELVRWRRQGRRHYYRLNPRPLRIVALWISPYERFWKAKLKALGRYLEKKP